MGKTKERILDTALALFNQHGSASISTNHIADAMGISPGNLYYHFRSKGAIIAALFERLFAATDTRFDLPADRALRLDDLAALIRINFELLHEYRFIYREMLALLLADPELHQRYIVVRERGYTGFREIVHALRASGVLALPDEPLIVEQLADLCWLISEFWLSSLEMSGHAIDQAQFERGIALMLSVFRPYLTRSAV
ncbi:MAG: TetR/AcrR family transcriptional regulator [bacterium]|nr:TetR/AcrR family transcriptional regulator [bacterium]